MSRRTSAVLLPKNFSGILLQWIQFQRHLLPLRALHVIILAYPVNPLLGYFCHVPVDKTSEKISAQVAALLKEEREKRGLSLNELSQRAGLARQTVSYVEQEVQNPTLNTLLRITAVLQVDLAEIITLARERAFPKKDTKKQG